MIQCTHQFINNCIINCFRPECSSNIELEKPPPPITVINPKKNAWTDKDLNLLKRLQSLKRKEDETATSITTSDIAIRLANLKGESSVKSYKYVNNSISIKNV